MSAERHVMTRRQLLATLGMSAAALTATRLGAQPAKAAAKVPTGASSPLRDIVVYKDPSCGCCADWVKHMRANGFKVTVHDLTDMNTVKESMGIPAALASCHTGRIGKYSIEGHVPADVIAKLVAEQPAGRGLAVPGMPNGSPGMETTGKKDKYDVLLFDAAGKTRVYASR
jgi:hypothetical protein